MRRLLDYRSNDFLPSWEERDSSSLPRQRKEPISALSVSLLLGLGAAGVWTGISSLVLSSNRYSELCSTID